MSILEAKGIEKIYNQGKSSEVKALKQVDLSIDQGNWVSIMGKSGSGKSTLLHILGLVDKYTSGSLIFDGQCVDQLGQNKVADIRMKKVGFVLQDFGLIWNMNVFDNIAAPLYLSKTKKNKVKVILADEPTGALDKENAANIMDIFARIKEKGTTIVMVTHDKEISQRADREITISDGRIM